MININKVEFKKFPGGELHITSKWLEDYNRTFQDIVLCRIQNSDDLMKLCLFTDAFKNTFGKKPSTLVLPYIPYARQDRVANLGEALSIKVFTNILNSLGYQKVVVMDPHSDVCTSLIDNISIKTQWDIWGTTLETFCNEHGIDVFDLISPDAGAAKKIHSLYETLINKRCDNIRIGMKHRDTCTRQISETFVFGEKKHDIGVIVDDICDSGETLMELAKVLKPDYKKLILCVTHGIFSKGLNLILKQFDHVMTTNSWNSQLKSYDNFHVIEIKKFIV